MKKTALVVLLGSLVFGACNGEQPWPADWDPTDPWEANYTFTKLSSTYATRAPMENELPPSVVGGPTAETWAITYDPAAQTLTFGLTTLTQEAEGVFSRSGVVDQPIPGTNCKETIESGLTITFNREATQATLTSYGEARFLPNGTPGPQCPEYLQSVSDGFRITGMFPTGTPGDLQYFVWGSAVDMVRLAELRTIRLDITQELTNLNPSEGRDGATSISFEARNYDVVPALRRLMNQMQAWHGIGLTDARGI